MRDTVRHTQQQIPRAVWLVSVCWGGGGAHGAGRCVAQNHMLIFRFHSPPSPT